MAQLKFLNLKNFRNHKDLSLNFGEKINLILGNNARGKTNILESIYFLSRGRSFRAKDSNELIMWGEAGCKIEAAIERACGKDNAFIEIEDGEKRFRLNGKNKRNAGVGIVLFVPADIMIFRALPQVRRDYLDDIISPMDKEYETILKSYSRIVTQRNRILRDAQEIGFDRVRHQLDGWDEQLISQGTALTLRRARWIGQIGQDLAEVFTSMGGVGVNAQIEYLPYVAGGNASEVEEIFRQLLAEKEDIERVRGATVVGPHRDDWTARIADKDIRSYGSQGQMRVMALSLKVIEMMLLKEVLGETPILLLDDVISELDETSAARLLKFVQEMEGQVFITSTDQSVFKNADGREVSVFSVS